jgi:hypothetical protein
LQVALKFFGKNTLHQAITYKVILFCVLQSKVGSAVFWCANKSKLIMVSHSHLGVFNMELCWVCGEIRLFHIEMGVEKGCSGGMQLPSIAVLWQPQNRHTNAKS